MSDQHSEITSQGWFSRIAESIKGILIGIILFLVAFPVLFFNEERAVDTARGLEEGAGVVVSVDPASVSPANEGKLVHVTGSTAVSGILSDSVFATKVQGLALRRQVEMFQWVENKDSQTRNKVGGGTETVTQYNYETKWVASAVDSGTFKQPQGHTNPGRMKFEPFETRAPNVALGSYRLSSSLIARIDNFQDLPLNEEALKALPEALRSQYKLDGNTLYFGEAPTAPKVGDTRVSFAWVAPGPVSIVAQQKGNTFQPFQTSHDHEIELLQIGAHPAKAMFDKAQSDNTIMTWLLRGLGFILMAAGLNLIFRPFVVVADVLPFVGRLVGAGIGLVTGLVAAMLSLTTIAIGWIAFRPLLAFGLLAVAGALVAGVVMLARKRRLPATS